MKKVFLFLAVILSVCVSGCKVGAGCALPFAAIGDTLVAPLNGVEWCSDKLIDLGDDHQMKVYEETRNTTYGDLAAYTAWVYYLPGYILWPIGALAPSELYPMTKSCMAVLNDENDTAISSAITTRIRPSRTTSPIGTEALMSLTRSAV